jgi:hypothetical protein
MNLVRLPVNRVQAVVNPNPNPQSLASVLHKSQMIRVIFGSEHELQKYRSNLYSINAHGIVKYRTVRDNNTMYGLKVWRIK